MVMLMWAGRDRQWRCTNIGWGRVAKERITIFTSKSSGFFPIGLKMCVMPHTLYAWMRGVQGAWLSLLSSLLTLRITTAGLLLAYVPTKWAAQKKRLYQAIHDKAGAWTTMNYPAYPDRSKMGITIRLNTWTTSCHALGIIYLLMNGHCSHNPWCQCYRVALLVAHNKEP